MSAADFAEDADNNGAAVFVMPAMVVRLSIAGEDDVREEDRRRFSEDDVPLTLDPALLALFPFRATSRPLPLLPLTLSSPSSPSSASSTSPASSASSASFASSSASALLRASRFLRRISRWYDSISLMMTVGLSPPRSRELFRRDDE